MLSIPSHIEALLFDCDGTLADSMPLHIQGWLETLALYGLTCEESFINDRAGWPTERVVEDANRRLGFSLDPTTFAAEKESNIASKLHLVKPIQPVLATAQHYFEKLPMAVVSGGQLEIVSKTLEAIQAFDLFSVFVTADDPIPPKPAPDVFLEAARQLGVEPSKCHVFEDGDPGIEAAIASGMTYTDVRQLPRT